MRQLGKTESEWIRAGAASSRLQSDGVNSQTTDIFSGILRKEGDSVTVWFDHVAAGTKISVCTIMNGWITGEFCSGTIEFDESMAMPKGNLFGYTIPVIPLLTDQYVEVTEVVGSQTRRVRLSLDSYNTPSLLVAAYEQQIQMPTSTPKTTLKMVGDMNLDLPTTVFVGTFRVTPKVLSAGGIPRETVIELDPDVLQYLGSSYPLTVCQRGECATVTVKHFF